MFLLLTVKQGLVLTMDRTNWKYGKTDINVLLLGVTYKNVAFPLTVSHNLHVGLSVPHAGCVLLQPVALDRRFMDGSDADYFAWFRDGGCGDSGMGYGVVVGWEL